MKATLRLTFALIFCALSVGCWARPVEPDGPDPVLGPAWFEDVTASSGLDFVHGTGDNNAYFMPASMGSGCAFLDIDGDGLLDIYLVHLDGPNGKKNQLFRQGPVGRFTDVSSGSGLDITGYSHGVAVGDINNDGRPDVLVTQYGATRLFLNVGGGKFQEITKEAGIANPVWGMSAAFLDYDRDGWLDLVIVNYLAYFPDVECRSPDGGREFCGPNRFRGLSARLYRNLGADGKGVRFEDTSFQSGIARIEGPGLGVRVADFDGDGWPDVFVANDGQPNRLWINQKDGTFREEAVSRGVATTAMGKAYAGMGVALGDVAGSGMLDVFVTHLNTETHTLWKQGPRGLFTDATVSSRVTTTRWRGTGFGTLLADFDLNGALDLAIVNGRIIRGGKASGTDLGFWEPYAEKNQLLANDGTGTFRDMTEANPAFCDHWNVGRGLACADFDNDGAPDLLVLAVGGKARLFRNIAQPRGHWLKVRTLDPRLKRDAYGAEVRLVSEKRTQLRVINPAEGYLSSGSPLALYGLGEEDSYLRLEVQWPDGLKEHFPGGPANRTVELLRGEGRRP